MKTLLFLFPLLLSCSSGNEGVHSTVQKSDVSDTLCMHNLNVFLSHSDFHLPFEVPNQKTILYLDHASNDSALLQIKYLNEDDRDVTISSLIFDYKRKKLWDVTMDIDHPDSIGFDRKNISMIECLKFRDNISHLLVIKK